MPVTTIKSKLIEDSYYCLGDVTNIFRFNVAEYKYALWERFEVISSVRMLENDVLVVWNSSIY